MFKLMSSIYKNKCKVSHNYNIQDLWFVATSNRFQPHSLSQIPKSNSLVQTKSQFTKLARMKKSKLNQSRWRSRNQSLKWWWWWHLATREWRCDKRQQKVCSMASNGKEQSPPTTTNVDCGSCDWQMAYFAPLIPSNKFKFYPF
jgi:hypothetical protein